MVSPQAKHTRLSPRLTCTLDLEGVGVRLRMLSAPTSLTVRVITLLIVMRCMMHPPTVSVKLGVRTGARV